MGGEGAECGPHPEELPGRERAQTHTCGAVIPQEGGDHCTLRGGGAWAEVTKKGEKHQGWGESKKAPEQGDMGLGSGLTRDRGWGQEGAMHPDVTSPTGSATTTLVLSQEQKQCVLTPAADASFGLVLSGLNFTPAGLSSAGREGATPQIAQGPHLLLKAQAGRYL